MTASSISLGLIGGTFNPVHYGHLLVAESARCEFGLEKIIFIPAARPPHKEGLEMLDGCLRSQMVDLAIKDNPFFQLSTLELERPGPSYTVDTLTYYQEHYPGTMIYFIMGADSLLLMETWKNVGNIARLGRFIVVTRPGYHEDWSNPAISHLPLVLRENIHFLEIPGLDISSSDIRRRLRQRKSIENLVPPQVEEYIYSRRLYTVKGEQPC